MSPTLWQWSSLRSPWSSIVTPVLTAAPSGAGSSELDLCTSSDAPLEATVKPLALAQVTRPRRRAWCLWPLTRRRLAFSEPFFSLRPVTFTRLPARAERRDETLVRRPALLATTNVWALLLACTTVPFTVEADAWALSPSTAVSASAAMARRVFRCMSCGLRGRGSNAENPSNGENLPPLNICWLTHHSVCAH